MHGLLEQAYGSYISFIKCKVSIIKIKGVGR
jgi:hypothetical protein